MVRTVLGDFSPDALGATLFHEHISIGLNGADLVDKKVESRSELARICAEKVSEVKERGIQCIVDSTPIEMGRDPKLLVEVATKADIHIICSTGLSTREFGFPAHFCELGPLDIADLYIKEITEGIQLTGVKAGLIKLVSSGDDNQVDINEKLVLAASVAHAETGVAISTYSPSTVGEWQASKLIAYGVEPDKIVIGNIDNASVNYKYIDRLSEYGVFLGFDNVGYEVFLDDLSRASLIDYAVRRYGASKIILSMGSWAYWHGFGNLSRRRIIPEERRGFTHLHDKFLSEMGKRGISNEEIAIMLTRNPQSVLNF